MDSEELHQWMLDSFGAEGGEEAWQNFQKMPESIREQMMQQAQSNGLPSPDEMHSFMDSLRSVNLQSLSPDLGSPINRKLYNTIAHGSVNDPTSAASQAGHVITAGTFQRYTQALSETSLWLDSATDFTPAPGKTGLISRSEWIDSTADTWINLATPVAKATTEELSSVFDENFGGASFGGLGSDSDGADGEDGDNQVIGVFAGPVPIQLPDGVKKPSDIMRMLGVTSFSMQMGVNAAQLSKEVFGSFDQGIAMVNNAAGAVLPQNIDEYARRLDIPHYTVVNYLVLREQAFARLYSAAPWLPTRIQVLVEKYARGISVDRDAIERELRESTEMSPQGISGAVNMSNIAMKETDEQKEAKRSLETLLALVEGWVDCVTWRAAQAYLPQLDALREMLRRRRAVGGPAEQTFENLLGLELRPVQAREACQLWEELTAQEGISGRDAHWHHPDLLPTLPSSEPVAEEKPATPQPRQHDWDSALDSLLAEESGDEQDKSDGHDGGDSSSDNQGSTPDSQN